MWYVTAAMLYLIFWLMCCHSYAIVAVVPGLKGYMMILMLVSQKGVFLGIFD
jgi:hypothetical protein